jgi:lipopolysaccharide/colanic/teichoic acid biosynthesis glycosyltransferase
MIKRALDVAGAALALVLAAPLLLVLGLAVRASLGAPVLFRHERAGRHGRPFTLCKLRTMTDARDASGRLRADAERLTPFGAWLRRTSLDELPELIHVLAGRMSLVGPRPLPVAYLPRYTREQARRHEVRPGITGWAQVHGRNALGWDERLALDVWYVDHRSLALDLRIMARTLGVVLRGEGIAAAGEATMPEFRGPGEHA